MDKSTEKSWVENDGYSQNRESSLVLSIDQNGRITRFNKECEKITGYDKNEVLNSLYV